MKSNWIGLLAEHRVLLVLCLGLTASSPLSAQQPNLRATFDGENNGTAVALSGDGKILASESEDETVKLWDVTTGKLLTTLATKHQQKVPAIAISRDGRVLATGGQEGTVKVWDVPGAKQASK